MAIFSVYPIDGRFLSTYDERKSRPTFRCHALLSADKSPAVRYWSFLKTFGSKLIEIPREIQDEILVTRIKCMFGLFGKKEGSF